MPVLTLKTPVSKLFMVGPTYAQRLKRLKIETIKDLFYHFPHRYDDFSLILPINRLRIGEKVTIQGRVESMANNYTKTGKKIQKAIISDESGEIEAVWFNQPFLIKTLRPGAKVNLSGKIDWFGRKKVMTAPEYEILKRFKGSKVQRFETIHTGRLVPVYPETYGVSSKWLRSRIVPLIQKLAPEIEEFLPSSLLKKYEFPGFNKAIEQIHFPTSKKKAVKARKRFAFEELFLIHLVTQKRKEVWKRKKLAFAFSMKKVKVLEFLDSLPFRLTSAQKKASKEILADLAKRKPMNRLLEGDVGSGKTVVSAIAIFMAFLNNCQSALMAPTEILAKQHFETLKNLLLPFGLKISLITGSVRKKQTDFDLIIGTHALIHKRVEFKKLGLVVVDEQHRFGVEQRGILVKKAGKNMTPHFLTMTATPIPRTIALTLYGDLDLSLLDELPPGRTKIKTWVVPNQKRKAAYGWIKDKIKKGDQVFIICPLIEESESESLASVRAVKSEFKKLKDQVFSEQKLGLLHGRMKAKEKDEVLAKFRREKIDILVATPVVEVGIDIPNATIMMVEGAERFGLAQLHQLRGRVGRGKKESYNLLFSEKNEAKTLKRLKSMEKNLSGAELAETDLKLRGPGEIYGIRQHGFLKLKLASFSDLDLVRKTQREAQKIILELDQYPLLKERMKEDTMRNVEPN